MSKFIILIYGILCYAIFFLTFLYLIAFVGNFDMLPYVTKTIDSGGVGPMGSSLLINIGLVALFGLTHGIMARPWFKAKWTRIIPKAAERSTYVLVASVCLIILYINWMPMPEKVWNISDSPVTMALWVVLLLGFGIVLLSTFLINHFELFGLSQVYKNLTGDGETRFKFSQPLLYKLVRHPLYAGFIIAFWATPSMSVGHLLFATLFTAQILISIPHEEKDIEVILGEPYKEYLKRIPMLIPFLKL